MKDLMIDASLPIAASLRLACSEPHDDVIQWLHDRRLPDGSEYLLLLITLWHVCSSLWHPDLLQWHHVLVHANPNTTRWHAPSESWPGRQLDGRRLASTWPTHPIHVVCVLTSPASPGVCNAHPIGSDAIANAWLVDPDVLLEDDGTQGVGGAPDSDLDAVWTRIASESGCAAWTGTGTGVDGSTRVQDRTLCVALHRLDSDETPCSWQGLLSMRARATPSPTTMLQDSHEAHGVGAIVKALVQQNTGASLILRMIVCVAALLCCLHSMLVLGERRPSFIMCRRS